MIDARVRGRLVRLISATPFKLFLVYVWCFCLAVALTFIYVYMNVYGFLDQDADDSLKTEMAVIQQRFETAGLPGLISSIRERSLASRSQLYFLADASGRRVAGNLDDVTAELWSQTGPVDFSYRPVSGDANRPRMARGFVLHLSDNAHLIVAQDVQVQENLKRLMRLAFLAGYAIIVLIGVAGAIVVSTRMLSRVDAASSTAHAIMEGNLAERIPLTGRGDEFDRLAQNLNAMLDRIQHLMTGLKEVSDNIAHDLKTPLHRLRTGAERALKTSQTRQELSEALGAVIEEADGLIQTFDALLSIARLEAGSKSENFGAFNICALVQDVAELYEPAAEDHGLAFKLECGGNIEIAGEKQLIGQALANLLDNAIKYASSAKCAGATVNPALIEIALQDRGATVDLVVADSGPGIPAADRERVFQRFVRLQPSRSIPGSGLGLSLVAAVARLHGGSVELEDNAPGLRVRLRLAKNLHLMQTPQETRLEQSHAAA